MTQPYNSASLRQIISRLERLSADSTLAHRAAGLRGSLLESLAELEAGHEPPPDLTAWVEASFAILVQAAQDIPGMMKKSTLPEPDESCSISVHIEVNAAAV